MSQLTFNPSTGAVAPTTQEIREDIAKKVQQAFRTSAEEPDLNVEPTSPMGQVVDLLVAEIEAKNAELMFLANATNPMTAQGKFLDALASLYGLSRKISEPTVVTCTLTGLKGTFIPYGVIAEDANGNQFRHASALGVTIPASGSIDSSFTAIQHGALEVPANTINKIVTVVAGWDSITNKASGVIGRIEETDAEFRNRMMDSYAINSTSSVDSIQANLAELSGVLDVVVLENPTGMAITKFEVSIPMHSIAVCIVGGAESDIAKVLFERKDVGCGTTGNTTVSYTATDFYNAVYQYKIIRPNPAPFKVRLTFQDPDMPETEREVIKDAVIADFLGKGANPRVKLASTVFASRFYRSVQGVTTYPLVKIEVSLNNSAFADSVDVPANKMPTIEKNNIDFVFGGN